MLKVISDNLGEYKKQALLSPFFVLLEVLMNAMIPFFMTKIIDEGILNNSRENIIRYGIILLIIAAISLGTGVMSGYLATKASSGLSKNMRSAMFYNITNFSFENMDKFKRGSLITRMTTDVQMVQMAFQMTIRMAIRSPLTIIFCFIMSFKLSKDLAPTFVIIIPLISIGMGIIIKKAYPIFEKVFKITDKLNTDVSENLSAIRVVKSFVKEDKEIKKFNNISDELQDNYVRASKLLALANPLMNFSTYLMTILIAWLGSHLIVSGNMSTGALTGLITYAIQIQISLMMLSIILVQITIARNSIKRIDEVISTTPEIVSPKNPIKEIKNGEIIFDDVYFSYSKDIDKSVLKNINLKIKSSDYVGIIGPTGSGKTTLINLVARLFDTTSGDVLVAGENVKDYDLKSLRDEVSVVLQKNQLFTGTLRENLKWARDDLSDEDLKEALYIASCDDFIDPEKDLDMKVQRGGTNFSGGQKQRISIARSILKNPKILIMDDSTSALDNKTEEKIIKSLNKLRPDMTKILISQKIKSLKNTDYIIVMDKGEIESIGTHKELIVKSSIYREINETQESDGDFDAKE
ncbi:MAG: ABC transporter ATP-binding protein [Peptoniphilus harei]|jgi:ABC transporter, ATP-binding protein|uniref:ABC transporter ATP-binding protein n=1 Tax=Peptoniphilus lacydonensis TaxID=1673725 RepID=UPI0008DB028D|nr:ABC transporter ATP-binding protein [Peptoniphilus lacydonensis]MBS6610414.1 ABC transporter ATP-binding protein [Peptoniphilus harei]MDU1955128.1 ABC transporter ATP-binding protein [Peptoniphilus lacydonensis]MDU2114843.1 ABC transporter ATP-binding protein [Peptoniphilus lacydonensis]MDU7302193.1 ABC transporter ATP-binding protein [Peptoniphilus lacydonensis]